MPLKKVTLVHHEAKPQMATVEIDVRAMFTLEDLKARHNRHIDRKADEIRELSPAVEPHHDFTPDMLAMFKAWNNVVGWDGFFKLPEKVLWADLSAAEAAARAAAAGLGEPVLTAEQKAAKVAGEALELGDDHQRALFEQLKAKFGGDDAPPEVDTEGGGDKKPAKKTKKTKEADKADDAPPEGGEGL